MGFFGRHNITTRADKISEFTVNTAEYGTAVPEVLGTTRLSGNVIYYDDFTAHEHKETHKSGKGGGSKSTSITYTYTVACILGLCEGKIAGIGKVWRGKEVYTYPNEKIELTAFLGTQTQKPWAYVVGNHPEKAMPYKGLAYMAGVVDMGDSASLPQYNFEIRGKLLNTGDGVDVNPADYIRYVLDKVGLESVEIEGLDNYRTYCREADLLISSPPDSKPAQAQNIVNEIAKLTNAYFFWSNDRFKIVPLETRNIGSWEADTTIKYDLTSDDFSKQSKGAMVTYSRKDSSEVYNSFPVEFINRNNAYEKETVNYQLSEDIRQNGLRQASSTAAHYFYTKERAVKVAEMLAKKSVNEKNTYTFVLNWAFALLEPGDIVTLTDENIGIDHLPVRIVTTTENEKGKITCTAVAVDNVSGVAQYDIHGLDRPYVNFNTIPPDTIPCIIQPPADLTVDGLELWIGGRGADDGWGGCTVYISDDNINYRTVGQINNSARTGTLQANITASATSCVVSCNDVLLSGTQQDAERGNTLCWIGGECLSYTTATLLQNGNYQLSGLVRGQYNTTATAHAAGEQFARLDGTLLRESFRKEDVGKKIWLKFCSYNIFGAKEQSLADVQPYQYTLHAYYIPPVINVTAYNRYRHLADGVSRYDVVVRWDPPALESYAAGQVWYRTNAGQVQDLAAISGVPASELGYYGKWIFGGQGKNEVVIPQAVVGDTYEIAVTTVDKWAASTDPDFAPKVKITVAMRTMVPNTPDGFTVTFGKTATAAWNEVTNTDVMYYEIRRDNAPGAETAGLLARTSGTSATVALNARSGRLYLFARNALGKYSVPAVLSYNKPAPGKPDVPTVKNTMTGFTVSTKEIPADAIGMIVYIKDKEAIKTENPVLSYNCEPGIYDVSIAYYDMFGAGERSATAHTVVKIIIDESMIKNEAISLDKVNAAIKEQLSKGVDAENKVSVVVDNLNAKDGYKNYSALTQLNDAINLRVKEGDVINQINVSPESILIDGSKVHITGETYFDDNIVTSKMLQAANISLEGALAITGGNVFLNEDGMQVKQSNGESIMFDGKGMTFFDASGNAYNSVRRMIIGTAVNGQYVKFPVAWPQAPKVLVTPLSVTTANNNKSGAVIRIHCRATDVSASGFKVQCYTGVDNTDYYQSVNGEIGSFSGVRGYKSGVCDGPMTWTKTFNIDSRARILKLQLYFSGIAHFKGDGIGIGSYAAAYTKVTVTAGGKTVLTQNVGGNYEGNVYGGNYFDYWNGITVTTDSFQVTQVPSITVKVEWRPRCNHAGKSNESHDTAEGKVVLQNISGIMQADDATELIDTTGTALFLAVDQSTQNYSVE